MIHVAPKQHALLVVCWRVSGTAEHCVLHLVSGLTVIY